MSDTQKMGFVGLGNMGRHMAGHLLEAGYDLTVFDMNPDAVKVLTDKGAKESDSVAALAGEVDVLFTALPGPPQVRSVALDDDGVIANAKSGSVYVDLTTNNPDLTREIYAAGKERGVSVVDAAMSGGMHGAESRRLSLMVGGDEDVAEKLRPALEAMSDNVVYCGESGAGTVTKVVNNFVSLTESALLGEALAMGVKWGVKLDTLADVIGKSSGSSWRLTESFPRYILSGNFKPGFFLDLAVKDLELANTLAEQAGSEAKFLDLSLERYHEAQDKGWGSEHSEAVAKLTEEDWGVELRYEDK